MSFCFSLEYLLKSIKARDVKGLNQYRKLLIPVTWHIQDRNYSKVGNLVSLGPFSHSNAMYILESGNPWWVGNHEAGL